MTDEANWALVAKEDLKQVHQRLRDQGQGYHALSEQQQLEHRETIGLRIRAILGQFWQSVDTPDVVKALELQGYVDVLAEVKDSELAAAWAVYQVDGPRSKKGVLLRPDGGSLRKLVIKARERVLWQAAADRFKEREAARRNAEEAREAQIAAERSGRRSVRLAASDGTQMEDEGQNIE